MKKYCCDPFKEHSAKKVKDLRLVTKEQAARHPSLVQIGMKLCCPCRKKLAKQQKETLANQNQVDTSSSESLSSAEDEIPNEEIYVSPEFEFETLNQSLVLIGESPLNRQMVQTRVKYLPKKRKRAQTVLAKKFDAVRGTPKSSKEEISSEDDDADDKEGQIIEKLKERFHTAKSRSEKIIVLTIFGQTWSRRKMMLEFGCSQRMATQAKHLAIQKGILATPNPKAGKRLATETTSSIEAFYRHDDISRVMPGKKDCFSILRDGVKTHVQKRLVLGNLKEVYQQFKEKNPNTKIGFAKFAMLRPKECVLAGASGTHSVCVCTVHNNVKLMMSNAMMETMTAAEAVPLKHYGHALAMTMCNPALPSCHLGECLVCPGKEPLKDMLTKCFEENDVDEVEFKQWVSTDRSKLETMVQPIDDFIDTFLEKLDNLRRHDFIAKQQSNFLNERKETLKEGEFLVIGDFSENFSFVVQDEAQSFHWNNSMAYWNNSMATLHPFVYYYKESGEVKHSNFVLLSNCNIHDTVAVHLFQKRLMSTKFNSLAKIIYFSDGCAGQYKNCKNFVNLCLHEEDFGVPCEWHFFATSHGKGPSDGIGGTIKREATKASLQRPDNDQILSPLQLFQFVEANLKGINADFVDSEERSAEERLLIDRFATAKTIAGTQKLHCFIPISRSSLRVKEYSGSSTSRDVSIRKGCYEVVKDNQIRGYIAVEYDREWWVAYVMEVYPERCEVKVSFLHPRGPNPSFFYPRHAEILVIDTSDVLTSLDPKTTSGRTYTISKDESQRATLTLQTRFNQG